MVNVWTTADRRRRQLNMHNKVGPNDVQVLYMYSRHTFMIYVM